MIKRSLMCIAALTVWAAAFADEVWSTVIGDVIYEADINEIAVLSYPLEGNEERGHVFISGLGGNYDDRGHFEGYWSEPSLGHSGCQMSIVDENGRTTDNWGRVTITFLESGFPSGWVAVRGKCFEEPKEHLVGNPIVAPGVR